jgi:hypothetical protein
MTHAQKPVFVFRRNGRVHLNRRRRQFSRLLDTPCSEVVWRVLATHSISQFPFTSPPVRHRVPSHFNWSLQRCMYVRLAISLHSEPQRRGKTQKQLNSMYHIAVLRCAVCCVKLIKNFENQFVAIITNLPCPVLSSQTYPALYYHKLTLPCIIVTDLPCPVLSSQTYPALYYHKFTLPSIIITNLPCPVLSQTYPALYYRHILCLHCNITTLPFPLW